MMRTRFVAAVLVLLIAPAAAPAQNREHLQMNADIRILQETVSRLQLTVNQLEAKLAATNQRLDEVSSGTAKGFADQKLLINQLSTALTAVRERLDDNTVRVSQLTQEFSAVREGMRLLTAQINTLVSLLQPAAALDDSPEPTGAPPAAGGAAPPRPAAGQLDPVILPMSATVIYTQAAGDYRSGRYDSAIEGFREVIEKYPDSPDAANAQLQIGDALYLKGNCRQAIPEYQAFLDKYKSSDKRPEGLLMLGLCYNDINQRANAQRAFEQVVKEHPNSPQAINAAHRLEGLGVKQP